MVLRDKDASTSWTSAADAVDERRYYCQNWRADVSAILASDGSNVLDWVKYSAYGVPHRIEPADYDRDGDVDANDGTDYDDDYTNGRAEADINFDGFVDGIDSDLFNNVWFASPGSAGKGVLSRASLANRKGIAGYARAPELAGAKFHVRNRMLDSELGRWSRRDPLGYVDGSNLYSYVSNMPISVVDSDGLHCHGGGCWGPVPPGPRPETDCLKDTHDTACFYACLGQPASTHGIAPDWNGDGKPDFCCICTKNIGTPSDNYTPPPPDSPYLEVIYSCVGQHEECHMQQDRNNPPYNNQECRECQAYEVSENCLQSFARSPACFMNPACRAVISAELAYYMTLRALCPPNNHVNCPDVPSATSPSDCGK